MLNLVEKFTPAVEAETDDAGLTTVEYAVASLVVAAGAGVAFLALGNKVEGAINALTGLVP
jgi:hypothetical protein